VRTPPINRRTFKIGNARPFEQAHDPRAHEGQSLAERARALRANATDAERILWSSLRLLRAQGFHFRRQAHIGPYIADFACKSARLIIELDGSQHGEADARAYDAARTRFLEGRSYRVLRFWNDEVFTNRDGVLDAILRALDIPTRSSLRSDRPPHAGEVN
jgi:very-short-patch-repair endonuclease